MMIYDLQKYRADRYDPMLMWMDFWFNAWTMFIPRVRIEAKVFTFPVKRPSP